ncbi:hypothetical protein GTY75_09145 [Streptomyces sp. SID8381]|uniref:hypothetical protein n=1 Tax=unclassified Streptomyces TaxID=2593676 RepID=UPI00039F24BB|nr:MULTISPECIES: hypothetical protein [unclassified Streptomyces]MYX26832.1 hypothetical protein [Streptomyces sp. SID8381]
MTLPSRPSTRFPAVPAQELMRLFAAACASGERKAAFMDAIRDKAVPNPHGPALPAAREPFRPTRHDVLRAHEMEHMAWRALLLHFGDMVNMHVLSNGGDMLFQQPGVAYSVHDLRHRGRVVGMWDEGADHPVFQLRAAYIEPQVARRIISAVQLLGGPSIRRPLHVIERWSARWARDAALYRPERCATFRRDRDGCLRVYTRPLTAAELAVVLESAAPEVRKFLAVRRKGLERLYGPAGRS